MKKTILSTLLLLVFTVNTVTCKGVSTESTDPIEPDWENIAASAGHQAPPDFSLPDALRDSTPPDTTPSDRAPDTSGTSPKPKNASPDQPSTQNVLTLYTVGDPSPSDLVTSGYAYLRCSFVVENVKSTNPTKRNYFCHQYKDDQYTCVKNWHYYRMCALTVIVATLYLIHLCYQLCCKRVFRSMERERQQMDKIFSAGDPAYVEMLCREAILNRREREL